MSSPSILLHACCAPCAAHVCEFFAGSCDLTIYFFNPNITTPSEYEARRVEVERLAEINGIPYREGPYLPRQWTARVREYRFLGEGSRRCEECFRMRLEDSFRMAAESGIDAVATTLSISPHKDADAINRIGASLQRGYGVRFIGEDFKKKGGYQRSVELSRRYGFYRQNYCGCIYSKLERTRDSSWARNASHSTQAMSS
ncbi:MAG: epoxyqueuosine reductase QueH [Spirochaetes bacterium]|nr:epoxyqueuosine reductase QueH [Spirochaetota bacterium]